MDIGLIIVGGIVVLAVLNAERQAAGIRRDVARLDRKLSLALKHLGVAYEESFGMSERVKELARDPNRKIEAIKVYRDETGTGLAEAKDAVEVFINAMQR